MVNYHCSHAPAKKKTNFFSFFFSSSSEFWDLWLPPCKSWISRIWMSYSEKTMVDPLLRDLDEKKESFRRNVVSLATELKQVRGRLVSQEQSFLKETITRKVSLFFFWRNPIYSLSDSLPYVHVIKWWGQILFGCWFSKFCNNWIRLKWMIWFISVVCLFVQEAEKRGKNMEMEICKLQKRLEERNCQLEASASAADKVYPYTSIWSLHNYESNLLLDYINLLLNTWSVQRVIYMVLESYLDQVDNIL